jgi:hypothetical protein
LLEAIFLLLKPNESARLPATFRNMAAYAADQPEVFWRWLFYNKEFNKPARIRASFTDNTSFDLFLVSTVNLIQFPQLREFQIVASMPNCTLMIPKNTLFPTLNAAVFGTNPSNALQDALEFNQAVLQRRKKSIEDLLRRIEPRLQAIELVQTGQRPILYADVGLTEMIPVTNLGQGFSRLLSIYTALMAQNLKVLLIDEIENGIHYSMLPVLWTGLALAAQELDVQIFATTHSLECITAAHEAFKKTPNYDFSLHRLQFVKGNIEAVSHDRDMLETALKTGLEVR